MRSAWLCLAAMAGVVSCGRVLAAQDSATVRHGDKGFEFRTRDNRFLLQIQPRLQFRLTETVDSDPGEEDGNRRLSSPVLRVQRARLKIGGHAFEPWLDWYFEYELHNSALLDFRVTLEKHEAIRLRVGQWKVDYNRERVISSGHQQMADRSLINSTFTLDRQQGASLFGHLGGTRPLANVSWWLGSFVGTGRGESENDDDALLWTGRLQWNPLGRLLDMTSSDLKRREKPEVAIAFAAATNRSPYTSFSQTGGGQLPGFEAGMPGQYRINQWMVETAYMHHGFSWQQEYHDKAVDDAATGLTTTMRGAYAQAGLFPQRFFPGFPRPLEVAFRASVLDPDVALEENTQREYVLAANWFFHGHLNKLTADLTWYRYDSPGPDSDDWRIRLQWDISF